MCAGLIVFLLFQAAPHVVSPSPTDELRRGRTSFDRGEYRRAVEILRPLLYPDIRLESDSQIVQAHRMLGVAQLFQGNNDAAAQEFRKLLQLRPDYRFDPLLDPPQVVDFFNGVLRAHELELATLEARQREAALARQRDHDECERLRAGPAVVERRYSRHSLAVNFVPFGAGQFQNSQRGKGWAFLTAEATLAAVSLAAFATNFAYYGLNPTRKCRLETGAMPCPPESIDHTEENRSRLLVRTQVASGAAFFAVVVWGIADALYYHRSEIPMGTSNPDQPTAKSTLPRLLPTLAGPALGPGLYFRF